jgi:CDP-diacylglycerol pyrophosphatase
MTDDRKTPSRGQENNQLNINPSSGMRTGVTRVAALTALSVFVFALAAARAATLDRGALWQVVQACVANYKLTGGAFPCLQVDLSGGEDHGFVMLRPPFGKPDAILSPTKRIVGVEDPLLQHPDAPNYFEDAWNARAYLLNGRQRPLAHDEVALGINSASLRSQDQLHIHIGCISRDVRQWIQDIVPELYDTKWVRIGKAIQGEEFWGRRVAQNTLDGVNPFHLATEGLSGIGDSLTGLMILIAGIRLPDSGDGFVLLVSRNKGFGPGHQYWVEDYLDASCPL